jgi:hypothetical protein
MHEIARHVIHFSEVLSVAIETVTSMIYEHEVFFEENSALLQLAIVLSQGTRRKLRFQITILKSLYSRSKALEERLRNEISLVKRIVLYDQGHTNYGTGV